MSEDKETIDILLERNKELTDTVDEVYEKYKREYEANAYYRKLFKQIPLSVLDKYRHPKPAKRGSKVQCAVMNKIDFRFWFCDCHYQAPYGKVIMGGCIHHDKCVPNYKSC